MFIHLEKNNVLYIKLKIGLLFVRETKDNIHVHMQIIRLTEHPFNLKRGGGYGFFSFEKTNSVSTLFLKI